MTMKLLSCMFFLGLVCACGQERHREESSSPVDVLIRNLAEQQILVDVKKFHSASSALDQSADRFCKTPTMQTLSEAQRRWQQAAETWYRVQLFNFGPADADPVFPLFTFIDSLRLRGTDYQESVRATQTDWLASKDKLNKAFFQEQRFDDVGLLAVELLLYGEGDLLDAYLQESRRCEVLTGLSAELARRAEELSFGWRKDYDSSGTPFVDLLVEAQLPNGRDPLVQVLVSGQEYADYLHKRSVLSVAAPASGVAWSLMEQAIDAFEDLLSAELEGGNLFFYMEKLGGPDPVTTVESHLAALRQALESEDAEAFEAALIALDGDFKREIPDALGVELGLTLTDGD